MKPGQEASDELRREIDLQVTEKVNTHRLPPELISDTVNRLVQEAVERGIKNPKITMQKRDLPIFSVEEES